MSRRYNGSGSLFQDATRLTKIEEALSQIVGQPCTLRVEWADDPAESTAKTPTAATGQQRQQRADLLLIPFVKKVTEILNAQIIKADDGFGALGVARPEAAESAEPPEDE